jgi:hypothetical protein
MAAARPARRNPPAPGIVLEQRAPGALRVDPQRDAHPDRRGRHCEGHPGPEPLEHRSLSDLSAGARRGGTAAHHGQRKQQSAQLVQHRRPFGGIRRHVALDLQRGVLDAEPMLGHPAVDAPPHSLLRRHCARSDLRPHWWWWRSPGPAREPASSSSIAMGALGVIAGIRSAQRSINRSSTAEPSRRLTTPRDPALVARPTSGVLTLDLGCWSVT